jgi:hypothetical protein
MPADISLSALYDDDIFEIKVPGQSPERNLIFQGKKEALQKNNHFLSCYFIESMVKR